jgi:hypothetical protein
MRTALTVPAVEQKRSIHELLVNRTLDGPGRAPADQRAPAIDSAEVAEPLRLLLDKVATGSAHVLDADFAAAMEAGFTDAQLLELVICARSANRRGITKRTWPPWPRRPPTRSPDGAAPRPRPRLSRRTEAALQADSSGDRPRGLSHRNQSARTLAGNTVGFAPPEGDPPTGRSRGRPRSFRTLSPVSVAMPGCLRGSAASEAARSVGRHRCRRTS